MLFRCLDDFHHFITVSQESEREIFDKLLVSHDGRAHTVIYLIGRTTGRYFNMMSMSNSGESNLPKFPRPTTDTDLLNTQVSKRTSIEIDASSTTVPFVFQALLLRLVMTG